MADFCKFQSLNFIKICFLNCNQHTFFKVSHCSAALVYIGTQFHRQRRQYVYGICLFLKGRIFGNHREILTFFCTSTDNYVHNLGETPLTLPLFPRSLAVFRLYRRTDGIFYYSSQWTGLMSPVLFLSVLKEYQPPVDSRLQAVGYNKSYTLYS